MTINKSHYYLKSYFELELFRTYVGERFSPIFNHQHSESDIEKLLALMGILAVGEHSIGDLDKYFTNDYLKNALQIKHYERFNLDSWLESEQFSRLLLDINNILESSKTYQILSRFFEFEENRFDHKLQPIFSVVSSFLCLHYAKRNANMDGFKKIDFSQKLSEKFDRDGYLIIKNFLSNDEVGELKKMTEVIAEKEVESNEAYLYGNGNKLQRIFNILNKHQKFRDLIACGTVVKILECIFARKTLHQKYYLSSFQANILNSGSEAQRLHTDLSLPDPLPPWLIRVNVNFLLDDFTEDNGATMVVPGSHKLLRKPTGSDGAGLVKLIAPRGSLVIWTGHLWHKSGANDSEKSRTALLACFAASYFREIAVEENYLEVMSKEALASSSKVLQNMLGVGHGVKHGAKAITILD